MIAAQRRALILEHLRRYGADSIMALAQTIGVSPSTIRRDLDYPDRERHIVRSHGGAILSERLHTTFEPQREIDAQIAHAAKAAIGARAAELLETGQSVIFDSSSTVLEAAKVVVSAQAPADGLHERHRDGRQSCRNPKRSNSSCSAAPIASAR